MNYYTNVQVLGSKILYRGIENGRKVTQKVDYYPTLFVPSKKPTDYTTIHGEYVGPLKPGNIKDTRDFLARYEDVDGFRVFGNTRYEYCFISDNFPGEVKWDKNLINVCNIDIEVGSENGFPEPEDANEPITAITFKMNNKFVVLGCGVFKNTRADVTYIQCRDEIHLIKVFLDYWSADYPDVVTGWNIRFFDIPYIINRITKLLGEKEARRMSPWRVVREKIVHIDNREEQTYTLLGVAVLDAIEMYKKFVPGGVSKASHKLGDIADEEVGEGKLSYEEYGTLHSLYREDYQKFIEYNIRDVELVEKIDNKHKMIDLVLTLCYDNKCNFEDSFQQVRMWDALCYNKLRSMKKVVPQSKKGIKKDQYIGAFVKEPVPGKYNWVVSEDLDSLYPHLIMQANISPDKFIDPSEYTDAMREFISKNPASIEAFLNKELDLSSLKNMGVTMTPNGQLFKIDAPGFLTELMISMYEDRKMYKKAAGVAKKELVEETDPIKRTEIEARIARNNNLQLAKKVSLNSAYGALGSEYFRFFDVRQAAAITTSGQVAVQWIQNRINVWLNKILKTDEDYVIASDTDSVYLRLDGLVKASLPEGASTSDIVNFLDKVCDEKEGILSKFIEKNYQELADYTNAFGQKMHMKREAIADAGVWTGKKRYALSVWDLEGVRFKEPQIKVTGLEVVRSSTPAKCRSRLKEAIGVALHGTQEDMYKFIEDFRKEFMSMSLYDISLAKGVNGMKSYHTTGNWLNKTPFHVKASMVYNRLIDKHKVGKKYQKIKDGDKIKYLYLKGPNTAKNDVIAYPTILPKEFNIEKYIDYDHQFEMAFLKPLRNILNAIGWQDEKKGSLSSLWETYDE